MKVSSPHPHKKTGSVLKIAENNYSRNTETRLEILELVKFLNS